MASRSSSEESDLITDINVTPLVDIMLVLLIVFMLTAKLIMTPSIPVDLPQAATGQNSESSTITITLNKNSELFFNGKPTSETELKKYLAIQIQNKKDTQAIIAADKAVPHGSVIHIIDLTRQLGISRFALNVEQDKPIE